MCNRFFRVSYGIVKKRFVNTQQKIFLLQVLRKNLFFIPTFKINYETRLFHTISNHHTFIQRHIGPNSKEISSMMQFIGVTSFNQLINEIIPTSIQIPKNQETHKLDPNMEDMKSEITCTSKLESIVQENQYKIKSLIGQGYVNVKTPSILRRLILENPGWLTSYTPYQPEIAQGRLEALMNFQTLITELTAMDVANASLLDEASAAAEAMLMLYRQIKDTHTKKKIFLASSSLHPQIVNVLHTRTRYLGIELKVIDDWNDPETLDTTNGLEMAIRDTLSNAFGCIVQYPDSLGRIRDYSQLAQHLKKLSIPLVVSCDPLALSILNPPGNFGAEIAVGSTQRLGLPMGGGGPHAGFMAVKKSFTRCIPGRIIGKTLDANGMEGYRMALQTREQHIRRDKATSNICTAQALLASISGFFGVYHGSDGLRELAFKTHQLSLELVKELKKQQWILLNSKDFFDTIVVQTAPLFADSVLEAAIQAGYNLRKINSNMVGITLDETMSHDDVMKLSHALGSLHPSDKQEIFSTMSTEKSDVYINEDTSNFHSSQSLYNNISSKYHRPNNFMKQNVFNMNRSETNIMRYIRSLEKKDLGLDTSMIPLGSCTMKLNPSAALYPMLWSEICDMHPFVPKNQFQGYAILAEQLCHTLCALTELDVCSLQPNSGATGEYAGLLAIRSYQESIGQGHRNICLIPDSAHGTNPASATAAGLRIVPLPINHKTGAIDMKSLQKVLQRFGSQISCAMITYPSTFGLFDENIVETCELIHKSGGLIYIDGANMNAQLGLTSPGRVGADVCHLNLHKTFAIPHGGGGPGIGPICVKNVLADFLPSRKIPTFSDKELFKTTAVAAAPLGSAMLLPIPWMFISMLGYDGLRRCSEVALLNANYMVKKLKDHYTIKYLNKHGRCGHEFIIDVSQLKRASGVTEEDIAKRLMDYGFHAPTISWPLRMSLMIEPTESETKSELDRYCDALILIRKEIHKIEKGEWPPDKNPLKSAPHTVKVLTDNVWKRPYTRQEAGFPAPWLSYQKKFWPAVGRLNNTHGDKNLCCTHKV